MQHAATRCNILSSPVSSRRFKEATHRCTLRHTATYCKILQHATTRCNSLSAPVCFRRPKEAATIRVFPPYERGPVARYTRAQSLTAEDLIHEPSISHCKRVLYISLKHEPFYISPPKSTINQPHFWPWCTSQDGEDPLDALSRRSFFAKEPLNLGLFCWKWRIQRRHPVAVRHPVQNDPISHRKRPVYTSPESFSLQKKPYERALCLWPSCYKQAQSQKSPIHEPCIFLTAKKAL